jgi:hypothetical protein
LEAASFNYGALLFVSGRVGRTFLQVGLTHNTQVRYTVLLNVGVSPDKHLTMPLFNDAGKQTAKQRT